MGPPSLTVSDSMQRVFFGEVCGLSPFCFSFFFVGHARQEGEYEGNVAEK